MPLTVDDQIAAQRIYTSEVLGLAYSELSQARGTIASITGINDTGAPRIDIAAPVPVDLGTAPQYSGSHFTVQNFDGERPTLFNLPSLIYPNEPPVPTGVDLTFVDPTRPTGMPDAGTIGDAPDVAAIVVPPAPNLYAEISGIEKPTITPIVIPDAPPYIEPEFTGVAPTLTGIDIPTDLDSKMRTEFSTIGPVMRDAIVTQVDSFIDREFPAYRSGLSTLETKLNTMLQGGTGIDATVEDAIVRRTVDKVYAEGKRAKAAVRKAAAQAGITMPGPMLNSQLRDADQAGRDNISRAATDVAIKAFDLEQQIMQFSVTQGSQLRQAMIQAGLVMAGHMVQVNGQAVQYAQGVVDLIVKAFDIAARYAEIQARIYESAAQVYESRLKGALAATEAWTARIRGLEAQANVDVARVNAYRARLEAVQAEASAYKASVDGLVAQASIERLKVDIYQARTQAYGAQVNAYTGMWSAYEASVRGETARIGAGVERYKAYAVQVTAQVEQIKARIAELQGVASANESLVRMYSADVEAFRARVSAESESVKAEVESFDTTLKAFIANANAKAEHARSEIASYQAGMQGLIESAKIFQQYAFANADIGVKRATGMASVSEHLASVYGNVAASGLSGANSLVSRSATE